jgi:hypothetical protein
MVLADQVLAWHPSMTTKDYKTNSAKCTGLCDLTFLNLSQDNLL